VSYSAPNRLLLPARHSIDTLADSGLPHKDNGAAGAWPSANLAIYVPIIVLSRILVRKLWFAAGTTATGNVDMALYDLTGTAVVSATNAAKSASQVEQVFDVTDTTVGPGCYYIALASDSATDTFMRLAPAAPNAAAYGVLTESSAYPLPSTATMTRNHALTFIPIMGMLIEGTVA
jgi:hypothetical protein